jgi:type VI secretion system protein
MVLKYEPRIKSPKVVLSRESSDLLTILFGLEGKLEVDDREIPLQLSTTVGASGKVNIN